MHTDVTPSIALRACKFAQNLFITQDPATNVLMN